MGLLGPITFLLAGFASFAAANVEKTIFLAPEKVPIPKQQPTLADLRLDALTHSNRSIRTHVPVRFPASPSDNGNATWMLLDNLTEGQRYEVRICWAATQPTAFSLDTFELATVWETPDLITSLAEYSTTKQGIASLERSPNIVHDYGRQSNGERVASVLLLRVLAAADYYTDDAYLMANPRPVLVDVILDPFLANVLPKSLVPTVGYLTIVAIISWFVAKKVASWLQSLLKSQAPIGKKTK